MSDRTIESPYRVDDARDDTAAAYKEVMERLTSEDDESAAVETPTSAVKEPVDTEGSDRPRDPVTKRFVRGTPPAKTAPLHPTQDYKTPKGADEKAKPEAQNPDDVQVEAQPDAASKAPPPSFSIKTKADWDRLPQHVRDDIVKRESEMQTGLAALRDFKVLKPYADMASQHGTSIKAALDRYTSMEGLLKKDLGAGLSQIAQNFGLDQSQAAQLFAGLAQKFGGSAVPGTPTGGNEQAEADPLAEIMKPILAPLMSQLSELQSAHKSRSAADQNAQLKPFTDAVAAFAADPANKFYPDLEGTIADLFEKGFVKRTGDVAADLRTAYDMAARMNPDVHEALIEQRLSGQKDSGRRAEQDKVAKAKAASRSISGSRIPGTVVQQAVDDDDDDDIETTVRKAYRLHTQG